MLGCVISIGYGKKFLDNFFQPPSPEVEQLATATMMTPEAEKLFYQQEPQIVPKESFRTQCGKTHHTLKKAIILGCYSSNRFGGKILIQAVSDERLQGTMEVTAAHEMLHAAYRQLSQAERDWLAPKLKAAKQWVEDPNLLALLEQYEAGDSDIYLNELHSHLGVELSDLRDPQLEKHYQRYFIDRQQVVALAESSQGTLNQLDAQANQLKPEIETLEASLKEEATLVRQVSDELNNRAQNLAGMRSDLMNLKEQAEWLIRQGDPSLVSEFDRVQSRYNAEVNDYNRQVQEHQDRVDRFNQQVETYEQKIETYNQLVETGRSILSTLEVDRSVDTLPTESDGEPNI
ncbi:MAG: hypothetical protein WBF52_21595 [Geitlerinemataceae cyanobacterium]